MSPICRFRERTRVSIMLLMVTTWFGAATPLLAQRNEVERAASDLASFDMVWETVRDRHWDPMHLGDKWDAAREELRPRVAAAKTRDEARGVIRELLERLEQSHFALIPSKAYDVVAEQKAARDGDCGLTLRLAGDAILVERVDRGRAADKAGVRAGWRVVKIDEQDVGVLIEKARTATKQGPQRLDTTVGMLCNRVVRGSVGAVKSLEFKLPEGEKRTVEITLEKTPGKPAPRFGNFPAINVHSESRRLESDVMYFSFNIFFDPARVMPHLKETIEQARDAKGLVLDLRGNYGGIGAMTMGIASLFCDEMREMGVMITRGSKLHFRASRAPEPYQQPLAVLIDECSISSAEILAGGLQDLGLARVFGRTTAGLALPSSVIKLPNGDGLQFAFATYQTAKGEVLEAKGVVPDVQIPLTPASLQSGADPTLQAAIEWIQATASK